MRKFWFDGQCSASYGLMASGSGTFNAPERDIEKISVMGRNGDLSRDNERFKNIFLSYPVSIYRDFARNAAAARAWLMSKSGYKRLEDEYNPDTFRMAMFIGPIDFDAKFLNRAGETTLIFDCKPQRFLKYGEHPVSLEAPGTLWNETNFTALPLITVYGSGAGSLIVGSTTVEIKAMEDHLVLDSDIQDACRVAASGVMENKNGAVYAPEFPVLIPGENLVSWSGDITKVEIVPRWWTL